MQKRVFEVPSEPLAFLLLYVGCIVALPWAMTFYFLAQRDFYMDRAWLLFVVLAVPTALVIWVLSRNNVARFELSEGRLTFLRYLSFGREDEVVSLPLDDVGHVIFQRVTNFGCPERYEILVEAKDGRERSVWAGDIRLHRRKLDGVAAAMRTTGIEAVFLKRDSGTGGPPTEWEVAPETPQGASLWAATAGLSPWLVGLVGPRLTHDLIILVAVGMALLAMLLVTGSVLLRRSDLGPTPKLSLGTSAFFWSLYYSVAATISYHTFK